MVDRARRSRVYDTPCMYMRSLSTANEVRLSPGNSIQVVVVGAAFLTHLLHQHFRRKFVRKVKHVLFDEYFRVTVTCTPLMVIKIHTNSWTVTWKTQELVKMHAPFANLENLVIWENIRK